jgi:hypothetical protein
MSPARSRRGSRTEIRLGARAHTTRTSNRAHAPPPPSSSIHRSRTDSTCDQVPAQIRSVRRPQRSLGTRRRRPPARDRLPRRSCIGRKRQRRAGAPLPATSISKLRRLRDLADYMGYCPHRRKTRVTGRPVICARCRRNARRKSRVARSSVMGHALASPPPPPSRQRHGRRPARPQGAPLVDVSQGRHPLGRLRTHSTDHDSTRRGPSFLAFTRRRHPVATA